MNALTKAAQDVLAERQRQIEKEGWALDHDDQHDGGGMAVAAACYSLLHIGSALRVQTVDLNALWQWTGWAAKWFKPKDRRRNLIRAAALLIAEIERLDRCGSAVIDGVGEAKND